MKYTQNLKLPIFDKPETDLFKISEWNEANENIDNTYGELKVFKDNLPLQDAGAEIVDARCGERTLGDKVRRVSTQLEDIENDVNLRGVSVKVNSLIGSGKLLKIKDVFPEVTLESVLKLNPNATIENSADWFIIQKTIQENNNIFIPKGDYYIDMPLICYSTPSSAVGSKRTILEGVFDETIINVVGSNNGVETKGVTILKNLRFESNNTSLNGCFISARTKIYDCGFNGFGGWGIKYDDTVHVVHSIVRDTNVYGNKTGGIYCKTNTNYQKTSIRFEDCYIVGNGNQVEGIASINSNHGMILSACLGVSVIGCVIEYNHGAGIEISNNDTYGVFNVSVISSYFEGNRYANILVKNENKTLAYKEILIKGNYYSAFPFSTSNYPTNSLLSSTIKTYILNKDIITDSIIDNVVYNTLSINSKGGYIVGGEIVEEYTKTFYVEIGTIDANSTRIITVNDSGIRKDGFITYKVGGVVVGGAIIQLFTDASTDGILKVYVTNTTTQQLNLGNKAIKIRQTI